MRLPRPTTTCFLLRPLSIFATTGVDICCFHAHANKSCNQKRRRAATCDEGDGVLLQPPSVFATTGRDFCYIHFGWQKPVAVVRGETCATSVGGEGRELQPATTCGTSSPTSQATARVDESAHRRRFFELAGSGVGRGHRGAREDALAGEPLLELSRSPPPRIRWIRPPPPRIRDGPTRGMQLLFCFSLWCGPVGL